MFRLLRAFLLVAGLAALSALLADQPGNLTLDWLGYRVETSFIVMLVAGLALSGIVYGVLRGYGWLRRPAGNPSRIRRGLAALTQGMTAIAAGDGRAALIHAARADALLGPGPLGLLMRAQAAQLAGDEAAASAHYTAMAALPGSEFLGLRGLLGQALRRGDSVMAKALALQAERLQPKSPWVKQTKFEVECVAGEWAAARETLAAASKAKLISKPEYDRRRGVLALAAAREAEAEGDAERALAQAQEAVKHAPGLAPAAALAARLLAAGGHTRRAARLIEQAWGHAPHPELAAVYATLGPANATAETAMQRRARFGKLLAINPDHPESRLLGAELAAGGMLPGAVGAAARPQPSLWICETCAHRAAEWTPLCPGCGGFDRLRWRLAAERRPVPLAASGTGQTPQTTGAIEGAIEVFNPSVSPPDDPGPPEAGRG